MPPSEKGIFSVLLYLTKKGKEKKGKGKRGKGNEERKKKERKAGRRRERKKEKIFYFEIIINS